MAFKMVFGANFCAVSVLNGHMTHTYTQVDFNWNAGMNPISNETRPIKKIKTRFLFPFTPLMPYTNIFEDICGIAISSTSIE